ncbi:hypothetical protein A2U01_0095577, partial [Trifolium medium]|nr:hypothetical protein [Trifolium medium]
MKSWEMWGGMMQVVGEKRRLHLQTMGSWATRLSHLALRLLLL